MGDFLSANNACGQNLLRLVSRGNAIIAEIMRLKDYVPPVFRLETKLDQQKYNSIILDFAYFKAAAVYEEKIENDTVLQDLDEEIRNNYSEILTRFYFAFESLHKYVTDLNLYIDELDDGMYIHQSIETVMLNEEGRQLMCEAVYLYGVMLLLVDSHFEGQVRERLLVSYYRYNGQRSSSTTVDTVCMLLRSTGYVRSNPKRPQNYPEEYFRRVPVNSALIEHAIGRLRSDEIYNQSSAFPHPEHRSTALSHQASMLVIVLFFMPATLQGQTAIMREIVDRFLPDNWVIGIYMGIVINLYDWWAPYKAAKNALNNTLETSNVKKVAQKYGCRMKKQIVETEEVLISIVSYDESTVGALVKLVRECNVTLHWILLHTCSMATIPMEESKRSRSIRQLVIQESKYSIDETLRLLLSTAQIERNLKETYKEMLQSKEAKWNKSRKTCVDRINDLAEVFSGNKLLDGVEKNDGLRVWFKEIGKHVDTLQEEDARKIGQLVQALEEVQEFHQLENNLHISQYLANTRKILHGMIRSGSVTEDTMIALNIVTDCSYAWNIMESFVNVMQERIKESPPTVVKLKALFLKMASALETPLLRVNQARSPDLSSVSQYYSRELESYARRVLQIIPETVFGLLADIVYLETNVFKEIPTKLPKDKVKDYAQLDDRLKMAKLTYAVSVFTKGVLSLKSVSLGILRVDSNLLLEDGIRQELVKKVTLALHNGLIFDNKSKNQLLNKLSSLESVMDGYRKSFQYIQDYININSLKIWHEEITYIIENAVESECRGSSWVPGKTWRHLQNEKINTHMSQVDNNSFTFLGRLVRELIRVTDPRMTVYVEHTLTWYDLKTQNEVINDKVFSMIFQAMGAPGLSGLDKLLSHFIAVELESSMKFIDNSLRNKSWTSLLDEYEALINSETKGKTFSTNVSAQCNKIWSQIYDYVLKIGHYQLLRNSISYQLNVACKFEAKHMEAALKTLNESVLLELRKKNINENSEGEDFEKCQQLLQELAIRLDWVGMSDPLNKIYVKPWKSINNMAFILFLLTTSQINKMYYCKTSGNLLSKKAQDPVDAIIFVIGILTVLQQFRSVSQYIRYFCKYIVSLVAAESGKVDTENDGLTSLQLLHLLAKYGNVPKSQILQEIPVVFLDSYRYQQTKSK